MQINTKFKIGQKIYIIFQEENTNLVNVVADEIEEILIKDDGIAYYCKKTFEEFSQNEIVDFNDEKGLLLKIKELTKTVNDLLEKSDK